MPANSAQRMAEAPPPPRNRLELAARIALLPPQQRDVAVHALRRLAPSLPPAKVTRRAPRAFGEWMADARPELTWTARHFAVMQQALDRATAGTVRRLLFQVPIRHGKTEHNTIGYGAYRLEQDPGTRLLVASYNQPQANKLSRQIRRLARARGVAISTDRDAMQEWETVAGGGLRAVGAGGGVASVNADVIILDDPIGSRDDAESPAKRDQVWDWLTNDILARCEPHTVVLMSMSRWHQDDPVGRLLDQHGERWTVVDLPAEAEKNDPLGRAVGEPLWPELRGADWLAEKRVELGSYAFASLLQQRPRPREGGMFKWDWWKLLPETPSLANVVGPLVRYWDLAGTAKKNASHDPDFCSGVLVGRLTDGRTCVFDVARFRASVGQRDAKLEEQARADRAKYAGRIHWWMETEAGIGGDERTQTIMRRVQGVGLVMYTERASTSKTLRAEPAASACEAGNLCLAPDTPERKWRDAFRLECADFPTGAHDDQVDGLSGAYNKVTLVLPPQPLIQTRFRMR